MSNFDSFSYFQTSLSLGVKQGLQKLPKYDINDLRHLFHWYILIARKCPRKTPFKTQCPPPPHPSFSYLPTALRIISICHRSMNNFTASMPHFILSTCHRGRFQTVVPNCLNPPKINYIQFVCCNFTIFSKIITQNFRFR